MDKLVCDYRDCNQQFKNDYDLNQHKHGHFKKRNLSINLPNQQINYQNNLNNNSFHQNLTPKQLTPFSINNLYKNSDDNYDDVKYQSPLFKETAPVCNPFDLTFKQATLNPRTTITNFEDNNYDKNESLNTPSIDLTPKKYPLNLPINCSKLDILVASTDQVLIYDNLLQQQQNYIQNNDLNKLDYQLEKDNLNNDQNLKIETSSNSINNNSYNLTTASIKQSNQSRPNCKRILPKCTSSVNENNNIQEYKVFLKLPDGSSLPISTIDSSTTKQQTTTLSNIQTTNLQSNDNRLNNYSPTLSIQQQKNDQIDQPINEQQIINDYNNNIQINNKIKKRRNSTKKLNQLDKVETTTLKSIKNALEQSNSQLNQLESANSNCSSQSSTTSSYLQTPSINENSISLDLSTNSLINVNDNLLNQSKTTKSKPGRRSKNQPKENPDDKKARSLERNREAAMRCRTKRKVWVSALEQKADELEQKNKELNNEYQRLKNEIHSIKRALLNQTNNGTTNSINSNNSINSTINTIDHNSINNSINNKIILNDSNLTTNNEQNELIHRPNSNFIDILIAATKKDNLN